MNKDQKAAVIDELAADIAAAQAVFAVDYRGITVSQAADLRARLRDADAVFRVVKNSLTERAADAAGAEALKELLQGPTALTFVKGDAAQAAKAIADTARTTHLLAFKGGVMDGSALTAEQVGAISRLPSRDALYGQLVGLVASPIGGLVRTLNALIGGLAVGLGGVLAKKESGELPAGEPPAAAAPEPEAAPEATAEAPAEEDAEEPPEAEAHAPAEEEDAEPPVAESPTAAEEQDAEPPAAEAPEPEHAAQPAAEATPPQTESESGGGEESPTTEQED
jgi:large subunit ribosomal protein L10